MKSKLFATLFRCWWRLAVLVDIMRALDRNDGLGESPKEYATDHSTYDFGDSNQIGELLIYFQVLRSNQI